VSEQHEDGSELLDHRARAAGNDGTDATAATPADEDQGQDATAGGARAGEIASKAAAHFHYAASRHTAAKNAGGEGAGIESAIRCGKDGNDASRAETSARRSEAEQHGQHE